MEWGHGDDDAAAAAAAAAAEKDRKREREKDRKIELSNSGVLRILGIGLYFQQGKDRLPRRIPWRRGWRAP